MVAAGRAREAGLAVLALTVDYGQRHRVELEAAARVAAAVGAERHIVLPLDLRAFGGSALTADIAVPKGGVGEDVPVTYVPARNTIFLSLALGWAEAAGAHDELVLSLARELLANAARHAAASRVDVSVRREPGEILLTVSDDGTGLATGRVEAALAAGGIGVASCRERVEALGGSLTVRSAPGDGTRAVARIPHIPEFPDSRAVEISRLDDRPDGA